LTSRYGLNGLLDPFYGTWGGVVKIADAAEDDVLRLKVEAIGRYPSMLLDIFPEKFVHKFIRDPMGVYREASPDVKKVLDYLIDKVGAKVPQDKEPIYDGIKKVIDKEPETASNRTLDGTRSLYSVVGHVARGL